MTNEAAVAEEFTAFTKEDIVYDDGCGECSENSDSPLAFVNREDPEYVIHETCYFDLIPRVQKEFIAIKDVPSGKLSAAERIGAAFDADIEEAYELEEGGIEADIPPSAS